MKKCFPIFFSVLTIVSLNLTAQKSLSFKNYRDGGMVYSISGSDSKVFIASSNGVMQRTYDGEVLDVFTTEKGLISDIVQEIYVVDDKEMWMATGEALHHYKDDHCLVFDQSSGLLNDVIYSICRGADGNIWVANFGGFSRYADNSWTSFAYHDTIGFRDIASYNGRIWGTTYGSGLLSFDGSDWSSYRASDGLPSDQLNVMRTDKFGSLWISSLDSGLIEYKETWQVHYDTLLDGRLIHDFQMDSLDRLWVFTDQGVLLYEKGQSWTEVDRLNSIDTKKGWIDSQGNVWAATDEGAFKYLPGSDSVLSFPVDGLKSNLVSAIKTGIGEQNWICTFGSISLYNSHWEDLPFSDINPALQAAYVYALDTDPEGNVWISYGNPVEVACLKDGSWTRYNSGNSSLNTTKILRTLAVDSTGTVWVGSESLGVQYFDGTGWKSLSTSDGLIHKDVKFIAVDRQNNKWFGTAYGLSRFDGSGFTNFDESNGLIFREVTKMAVDSKNHIWVGTEQGLSRFDGLDWASFTKDSGMAANYIRALAIDTAGLVWCGHQHEGLSVYDPDKNLWTNYGMDDGLASPQINAIDVDQENNLWIGSSFGLSVGKPSTVSLMVNAEDNQLKSTERKIQVPVSVSNFSRIKSVSFSMQFDAEVLRFGSFREGALYNLSLDNFDTTDIQSGHITLNYQNNDILCQTVENHSPIFYLGFDVISHTDSSEITLTGEPQPIYIENFKGESLSYELLSVKFSIEDLEITDVKKRQLEGVRVYPNPAASLLSIESDRSIESIQLMELSGRILRVLEGNQQNILRIELEDLPQGLYILRIISPQGRESLMIMKQ